MCTYIHAVIPDDADRALWSRVARRFGRRLSSCDEFDEAQLQAAERWFVFSPGCNCGTALGSRERASTTELATWCELLSAMCDEAALPYLGLLRHEVRGSAATETPPILRREEVALDRLTPGLLAGMEDDVLYVFGAVS